MDRSRLTMAPSSKFSSRVRQSSSLSRPRVNGEMSSSSSKRVIRNEGVVTSSNHNRVPRNLVGEQLFREKQMRHVLEADSGFHPSVETVPNSRSNNHVSSSSFHRHRDSVLNGKLTDASTSAAADGDFANREYVTEPKHVDEQTRKRESLTLSASDLYAPFPDFLIASPHDENTIPNLIHFLSERMRKQRDWIAAIMDKEDALRRQMRDVVLENQSLKVVISQYRTEQQVRDKMIDDLETRLMSNRDAIMRLKRNNADHEQQKDGLVKHIEQSREALVRERAKRKKFEEKLRSRARDFRERKEKELDDHVKQVHSNLEARLRMREQQLARVKDIIVPNGPGGLVSYPTAPPSVDGASDSALASSKSSDALYASPHNERVRGARSRSRSRGRDEGGERGQPVVNPRYRRSRSADRWIDHRPKYVVPTGTLTQPHIKDGKFVHQLQASDTKNATAYVLTHQEADTDGEMETRLYKGDIIPTATGGTAVVFKDVEVLRQYDPCDDEIRSPRYAATSASVAATGSGMAAGGAFSSHPLISNAELQKRCREALTSASGMAGGGPGGVSSSNNNIGSPMSATTATVTTDRTPTAVNSGPMPLVVTKRSHHHKVSGVA